MTRTSSSTFFPMLLMPRCLEGVCQVLLSLAQHDRAILEVTQQQNPDLVRGPQPGPCGGYERSPQNEPPYRDCFRNASSQSSKCAWKWLCGAMCDVIEISQLEDNAEAIDKALKPKQTANANVAPKAEGAPPQTSKRKVEGEKGKGRKGEKGQKEKRERRQRRRKRRTPKRKQRKRRGKPKRKPQHPQPQHHPKAKAMASPRVFPGPKKAKLPCVFRAYYACAASDKCDKSTIRITCTNVQSLLGVQVNQHCEPFVWTPDELPYCVKPDRIGDLTLRCPASAKIPVDRVEENVPIIRERVPLKAWYLKNMIR